ncbi:YhgE/Pip domain-containing protein [Latilactobacillus curvatus]|uniref:YhgE/Pip domain-containing protein n=1 Tax=Latilactobacillus curvatus TaxID=28038 RepID=UPI0013E31228|nr:YhgE/Pip domain-containing protein [Latilactobacillus curvatus]
MFGNWRENKVKLGGFIIMICLIPILLLLITFNFIKYEQTTNIKHMKVAVVNQDQSATFKGKKVAVGQQVLKTLRNDHQVDWQFVSAKDAKANLASGRYAMQVVLPKDFSKNATTALDKSPKVSLLKVETSKKNNYMAGMITTQVVNQMKGSVVQKIQEAYNQALLGAIGTLGSGVQEASNGVKKLNTAAGQLSNGSQQIYDNLNVLHSGTQQLADGSAPLASGVQQLTTGAGQLSAGLGDYTAGAGQINAGLNQLAANNQTILAGGQQISGGVDQLADGTKQLSAKLTEAANEIESSLNGNQEQLTKLKAGLGALNSGIQELDQKVNHSNNDNSAIIKADLLKIANNTKNTGALLQDSGSNLSQINDKVYNTEKTDSVASSLKDAGEQLKALDYLAHHNYKFLAFLIGHPEIRTQIQTIGNAAKKDLLNAGSQLQSSGVNMKAIQGNLGTMGANMGDTGVQLQAVSDELTKTADNMAQLKAGIAKMASKDQAPLALNGATQAIDTLTAGLAKVDTGLKQKGDPNKPSTLGGIQATDMIHDGLVQIQEGLKGKVGQPGLMPGLTTYLNGVSTAAAGSNQLVANNNKLNDGSHQLTNGLQELNQKAPTLVSGITQINEGSGLLADGAGQLTTGLGQAGAGISLLNVKLIDGSKQVANLSTGSANVEHFVQPVKDQLLSDTNHGSLINTFSPLVLTLVFFVGAMLTQLTLYRYGETLAHSGLKQRMLVVAGVVVAQALLIDIFANLFGLTIAQPFAFFVLSMMTSAVFTLACLALDKLFGTMGILMAFGLLFLQLIITGGLFPNDMLSGFYRGVAIFLPGTYTISGFEQVVNGNGGQLGLVLFILLVFCGVFFAGLFGGELKQKLTQTPNSQA